MEKTTKQPNDFATKSDVQRMGTQLGVLIESVRDDVRRIVYCDRVRRVALLERKRA